MVAINGAAIMVISAEPTASVWMFTREIRIPIRTLTVAPIITCGRKRMELWRAERCWTLWKLGGRVC